MNLDQIRDQVRQSRLDQGLPPTIAPGRVLDELAAEVCNCPTCESQDGAA
jgi:hypothetical protein